MSRISIFWSVFPNCTDILFSIAIVLSILYLSVLQGLLSSHAGAVMSIQKDFIPDTEECSQLLFWTGIWAHSRFTVRHLNQFVPPSLLHPHVTLLLGSTSGKMSSKTSGRDCKGTLSWQQNFHALMNHLFLKSVYLGLFIPNVQLKYKFGIHCNPAENLYLNHAVSNSTPDPKCCNVSFT